MPLAALIHLVAVVLTKQRNATPIMALHPTGSLFSLRKAVRKQIPLGYSRVVSHYSLAHNAIWLSTTQLRLLLMSVELIASFVSPIKSCGRELSSWLIYQ